MPLPFGAYSTETGGRGLRPFKSLQKRCWRPRQEKDQPSRNRHLACPTLRPCPIENIGEFTGLPNHKTDKRKRRGSGHCTRRHFVAKRKSLPGKSYHDVVDQSRLDDARPPLVRSDGSARAAKKFWFPTTAKSWCAKNALFVSHKAGAVQSVSGTATAL